MESIKMFFCQERNIPGWRRLIPAKLPNTLSGCPGTWLPMTGTMPIITPPSRSGWTRTARAGERKTTLTTITRESVGEDGLLYCGKCHTPKEAFYPADLQAQGFTKHPVMCKCVAERREREEAERREYERMSYMTMLRSEAFRDMPAAGWRFESAAVTTPQLAKARGYAQNWDEFKKAGIGLLLFGNVGTGKSYAAGCIANALIDRLESVLFVGMSDVVNRMQGNFGSDRDNYMKSLMRPDLLILDDLGAERNTSFGKERVFDVVDKRLLTGKPMIVTTNIPLSVMKQAVDLDDRRIYDRILEVCVPIMFDGDSFRKSTAADNLKTAARLLG